MYKTYLVTEQRLVQVSHVAGVLVLRPRCIGSGCIRLIIELVLMTGGYL